MRFCINLTSEKKSLFLLGKLKYFLADKQNLVSIIIQVSECLETLSVN